MALIDFAGRGAYAVVLTNASRATKLWPDGRWRALDPERADIDVAPNDHALHGRTDEGVVEADIRRIERRGFLFDLRVDDQDHTLEFLRAGAVLGAVEGDGRYPTVCRGDGGRQVTRDGGDGEDPAPVGADPVVGSGGAGVEHGAAGRSGGPCTRRPRYDLEAPLRRQHLGRVACLPA